jgi:sialate O-acetylesterase
MAEETLLKTPALEPYARLMRESLVEYRKELGEAMGPLEAWIAESRAAKERGADLPMPPEFPEYPFGERRHRPRCVTLHHGHIAPLVPMALRGVLWYQGENNADGNLYLEKKAAMVADWRKWFGDAELPFYFVQLAAWQKPDMNPAGGEWGYIRDVQRRCLTIPHTGMASAIDLGDAEDIHPKNKADVGER